MNRVSVLRRWAVVTSLSLFAFGSACTIQNVTTTRDGGGDDASAGDDAGGDDASGDAGESGDANPCAIGQSFCNGTCIDVSHSDDNCGGCGVKCTGAQHCGGARCTASPIQHVVLIVQENHTFDSYFGKYCSAPYGSPPNCTRGRSCCEAAPQTDPSGAHYGVLDDASNFAKDRNHDNACEIQQINGGAMDQFVTGAMTPPCSGTSACCLGARPCSDTLNWGLADGVAVTDTVYGYWTLADNYALADRYFQPIIGGTASNNMYFAGAKRQFVDNAKMPNVQVGTEQKSPYGMCVDTDLHCITTDRTDPPYSGDIASLLLANGNTFSVYADGYAAAYDAWFNGKCASPSDAIECPYHSCFSYPVACNGCIYDPSDIPFLYFDTFGDRATGDGGVTPSPYVQDYAALQADITNNRLPNFAFVKARLFHNEHPNVSVISDGVTFVMQTINAIAASPYAGSTLVLLTWDEGGGFFDHVAPPPPVPTSVDSDGQGQPVRYGTRVPFLAIGTFAGKGTISHVQMEHSSIVKFLEYNFLGNTKVGQLSARDSVVNNIGSVLDPTTTKILVPAGQ